MMRLIIAILLLLYPFNVFGYSPPVGIPDPGYWGGTHPIDDNVPIPPESWPSSETNGFYYIHFDHVSCSDSNTYGYPDVPRCTLPTTFAAGSFVEVHGYDSTDRIVTFNGTSANPIWLFSTETDRAVLSGYFNFGTDSQYALIDGIDFNGGTSSDIINFWYDGINHIAIRNGWVRNKTYLGNSAGINFNAGSGETINDIVIYNMVFSELGTWNTVDDEDFHGVSVGCWSGDNTSEVYNIWLLSSVGFHLSGNLIQINSGNWPFSYRYTHHVYVGDNDGSESRQAPFWIKKGRDVVFSGNTAHGMYSWGTQGGDGLGYQYAPDRVWWLFNTVYDTNFGIRQSSSGTAVQSWESGSEYSGGDTPPIVYHNGHYYESRSADHTADSTNEPGIGAAWETYWGQSPDDSERDLRENREIFVIGNLFRDIYPRVEGYSGASYRDPGNDYFRNGIGISLRSGIQKRYVLNNTLYNTYDGLAAWEKGKLYLANNLFSEIYDPSGNPSSWQTDLYETTLQHTVTDIDNELYWDSVDGFRIKWNGTTYTDPATMYSATSECQNCVEDDPYFVDADGDNYNLLATSPAVGAGTSDPYGVYSTFYSLYGLNIAVDYNGNARDDSWDIGAYEYRAEATRYSLSGAFIKAVDE